VFKLEDKALIVVGNGMTSQSFCRWLVDHDSVSSHSFNSITVFGDEPRPAYDRVNLTDCFGEKNAKSLELAPRTWYEKNGISLHTNRRVVSIEPSRQRIRTDDGGEFSYTTLVMATGSRPFVPPVPGADLEGVFVYRTIEDIESIKDYSKNSKTAAVLGGGLLGLEAAKALKDLGLITHVIEMAPGLMPRQLDRASSDVLRSRVERLGVKVHLTKRTEAIERHGDFHVIKFAGGDSLAVDMVVISAGIRPRDELGREASLKIGRRGGFTVNDSLQTSEPNIYAIGECVEHRGKLYGLVGPCYQMAKVLANRLRGASEEFVGGDQSAKLKLLGVDVCTFGEPIGQAVSTSIVSADVKGASRKLLIRDRQIVGAVSVGPWPEADRIRAAVADLYQPWGWQLRRFRRNGKLFAEEVTDDVSQWPPSAVICSCLQITRSDLTTACQQGCETVDALAVSTGASTVCGSCKPLLARVVGKAEQVVEAVAGWRGLFVASVTVIAAVALMKLIGPIEFADSVSGSRRQIDFFWRDDFWKQVSGYTLLGITVLSLLFSMRKRIQRIRWGQFGNWRMAHGILGAITLVGVVTHTGMHWGSNLNFWLMSLFIGLNLLGGFTGLVTSLESRVTGGTALMLRQWRPRLTWLHILLFWPLPLLIAAHVFSIYYY